MKCATVLYANKEGGRFDFDYYMGHHIPMVRRLLGCDIEVRRGLPSPTGTAEHVCLATIWFESLEEFQSMFDQHGQQILADVPNYTNIQPTLELQEVLVSKEQS